MADDPVQNSTIDPSTLYTVADICRSARLSRATIFRALNQQHAHEQGLAFLPSIKIGKSRRVRGRDYLAWLDACASSGA